MNLGKMLIFAALLSFITVGVLTVNSEFLSQTNSTAVEAANIESLNILNNELISDLVFLSGMLP